MTELSPYRAPHEELPERLGRWFEEMRRILNKERVQSLRGDGSPEGVVFAIEETRFYNRTGTAGTLLYVKTTGVTVNTGWVAYG